jgi:hypothetical protein
MLADCFGRYSSGYSDQPAQRLLKRRVTGNGVVRRLAPRANSILIRSLVGSDLHSQQNGEAERFRDFKGLTP